jgi:hypothetical protein
MMRPLLLAGVVGALALPAVAQAGSTQFVGDPVTYLTVGKPATTLNVVFRVNQPISGLTASVNQSGGPVLDTATPKALGSTGLCYQATFQMPSPVSNGSVLDFVLGSLQPNSELVRLYAVKKARTPANLIGGNC